MKKHLIAFDSDGCVFDAMEPKHRKCFIPTSIDVFGLHDIAGEFTELWAKINLYSKTRGVNRFLALEIALDTLSERGHKIVDPEPLKKWIRETDELSAAALAKQIENEPSGSALTKINEWSLEVNRRIKEVSPNVVPYEGAPEIIRLASEKVDVAVVTSANFAAIEEEWGKFGLLECLTELCGQERGTKKECLKELSAKGYDSVLMVGDAPGDLAAAEANGCFFYPIITGREIWSWKEFQSIVIDQFLNGKYINDNKYLKEFERMILCV